MKVLILKPSSLGDVVQALPVLRLLKRHMPEAEVYWWLNAKLLPLLEDDPDLSGIICFERERWKDPLRWPEVWRHLYRVRQARFDWVLDLQGLLRSGLMAWLARGGMTVGIDERREGARALYDVVVRRPSYYTHAVDWYLEVLRVMNIPVDRDFDWLPRNPEAAVAVRSKQAPGTGPWIVLQAGARWPTKRWPAEYFAELVRLLEQRVPTAQVAVLGGTDASGVAERMRELGHNRWMDLTGRTSLAEMVEWIRQADVVVSNDTGPLHVAAALDKPIVGLFGPTEPRRTGPYGQVERVLQRRLDCVPCLNRSCRSPRHLECLKSLSPSLVADQVVERLTQVPARIGTRELTSMREVRPKGHGGGKPAVWRV